MEAWTSYRRSAACAAGLADLADLVLFIALVLCAPARAETQPVELAAPYEYLGWGLGRLTFWAVNRDRPCSGADTDENSCGGIAQQPFEFSDLVAQYHG
jgi:hypothetical protein